MGGVCILLGVAFTLLVSLPMAQWAQMKYFFIGLAIIFATGLRDDILTLKPTQKLLGQILPIVMTVVFGHITLNSFYEIDATPLPTWLSWSITIFTVIILTNAFNLIDGIDGLSGLVSSLVFSFLGFWFFVAGHFFLAIICCAFLGSVIAFLLYNWQPSKIFMGDTGTLSIGFALAFLAIQFINLNFQLPNESAARFHASISTAVCVLIIPIFDTSRVIIFRLRKLQSPFRADRNHLHHQLLNLGFDHAQSTLILGALNLFFIGLALVLRNQPDQLILPIVLIACLAVNQILKIAQQKRARTHVANHHQAETRG